MSKRRKTIPLNAADDLTLRQLYVDKSIPSDQYERRPTERRNFVEIWNALTGRADSEEDVMHYIITKRKQSKWPTLNGTHLKMASVKDDFLTPPQWAALRQAYSMVLLDRGIGSDNLRFDRSLGRELAKIFRKLTGRTESPATLLAAIEARRKRGEWLTRSGDVGFGDIGEVG